MAIKDSIDDLYHKILNRKADCEGLNYYASLLDSGKYTLDDIKTKLENSTEKKYLESRLSLLSLLPKNSKGVEIGVWKGEFSQQILDILNPIEFHLIDPWKLQNDSLHQHSLYGNKTTQYVLDSIYNSVQKKFSDCKNIVIHRDFSKNILKNLKDNHFDWIYIDGDHTYGTILNDLQTASYKINAHGIICGDDYTSNNWWKNSVINAVNHFSHNFNFELTLLNTQFILRKK